MVRMGNLRNESESGNEGKLETETKQALFFKNLDHVICVGA